MFEWKTDQFSKQPKRKQTSYSDSHRSRRRVQEVVLGVGAGAGTTQGVLGDVRASGDRGRRGVADGGARVCARTRECDIV